MEPEKGPHKDSKRKPTEATGNSPNLQAARTQQNEGDQGARASGANQIFTVPDFPDKSVGKGAENEKMTLATLLSTQTKLLAEMQTQNKALTARLENLTTQQANTTESMNTMVSELQRKQEQLQEKYAAEVQERNEQIIEKMRSIKIEATSNDDVIMDGPQSLEDLVKELNDKRITQDVQKGIKTCMKEISSHARNCD